MHHAPVIIIGGGPAGFSASIYAARAGMKPIQFLGDQPGGQLMITTDVDNYPGFAQGIQGPALMDQMRQQTVHMGTVVVMETVTSVDCSNRPFVCQTSTNNIYTSDTIIIATGAQAKWLGISSEEKFRGFGVSGCATCDGFFFKNKVVAVIGGGNTAVEEALYLTNHAQKVYLIHRRNTLRAEDISQQKLFNHPKISIIWDSVVDEILGQEEGFLKSVTGIRIKNVHDQQQQTLPLDGVFVAIGHVPMTGLFKAILDMDEEGYIITPPGTTKTSIEGIFAAGDVQDKIYRQAVTAAGQGCMAALDAYRWLNH
jgi:thioredoxin reductase (NADPH)